jgi:hypothetical protein
VTGPIQRYLRELERTLPAGLPRDRILSEVDGHLCDAAAEIGEADAVARFGTVREVVSRFAAPAAQRANRVAALALAALLGLTVVPGYGIVENTLPPAHWDEGGMPDHLLWKRNAVWLLVALAVPPTLAALALLRRDARLVPVAAAAALLPLGASAVLGTWLAVNWWDDVPGTPLWLAVVPACDLVLVAVVAAVLARAVALGRAV